MVASFPKEACQHLYGVLLQNDTLHEEVQLQFTSSREDAKHVQQLFERVVDVRLSPGASHDAHIRDLRVILGKELRFLLRNQQLFGQANPKNFLKEDVGLREQLGAQFSEAMTAVKVEYERQVQQAGGGIHPISKISLTTVTEVSDLLLEGSLFSAKVQDFLSTLLQYPRGDITMNREQIELLVESYKQQGDEAEINVASRVFEHITDPKGIFATKESKVLFLKILGLFWETYYEYSRKLLSSVRADAGVFGLLFDLVLRVGEPGSSTLDRYGFASVIHMLIWQQSHATGAMALLQRSCRFLYSFGHFAPAHEFANRAFFLSTFYQSLFTSQAGLMDGDFRPTKQMFSPDWYSQLESWKSRDAPSISKGMCIKHCIRLFDCYLPACQGIVRPCFPQYAD